MISDYNLKLEVINLLKCLFLGNKYFDEGEKPVQY